MKKLRFVSFLSPPNPHHHQVILLPILLSCIMVLGTVIAQAAAGANPPLASSPRCCYYQTTRIARARPLFSYTTKSSISQLGAPWSGPLKHLPITSPSFHPLQEKKGKFVCASLFGVGAPEALVIGVVALLVFGPKGLAEVARNLGKTLRAFQPTIRELQDVSREFKSTLEREIGLDDVASPTNNTYKPTSFSNESQQAMVDPNGRPKAGAYTSEDLLKLTQEQLTASATGPQEQKSSPQEQQEDVADAPLKIAASSTPESAAEIQSSEKADKER